MERERIVEGASELARALGRAAKRLEKRAEAIRGDLARIDESEAWASRAPWLVPAAARAPRGATALRVSDWSTGVEQVLEFPLDPAKGAREQVEAAFARARRLRRGKPAAEARLAEAERAAARARELEAAALRVADDAAPDAAAAEAAETEAATADTAAEAEAGAAGAEDPREVLLTLRARAIAELPRETHALLRPAAALVLGTKRRGKDAPRPPYRAFRASGGVRVLVGRGAEHNDELTFDVARPHHAWLHVKGQPGAHVVVWNDKGKQLTAEQLVDAAHLAAHFSDARGEPVVDVAYTQRRYVRKPRRSPPGLVTLDREKILPLRLEASRLAALLAAEESLDVV